MKLVVLFILAIAATAAADPQQAAEHYRQGKAYEDVKQYDQAVAEYRKAYAIDQLASHLYNIARVLNAKGDYAAAIDHYQQYLAADPRTPRAKEVRAAIAAAEAKRKEADEAARIEADKQKQAQLQREAEAQAHRKQAEAYVQAGAWSQAGDAYRAAAAADGNPAHLLDAAEAYRKQPDLAGQRAALIAYLEKVPAGANSDAIRQQVAELARAIEKTEQEERDRILREGNKPRVVQPIVIVPRDPERPPTSARRVLGVVVGSVGVASIAVGGVFGVLARSDKADAEGLCTMQGTCTPEGIRPLEDARKKALGANVAVGFGLAAVATGVVLYLTAPKARSRTTLVPTGTGAAIVGHF